MRAPSRKTTIAMAAIATFVLSLTASAAMGDDTVVNLGYDENSHFFIWNVTSLDYQPFLDAVDADDELTEGDLEALRALCGITAEGSDPSSLDFVFDGETISFSDSEGGPGNDFCGQFMGAVVAGPAGQVNHGMFMKLFNSLYEGPHRGCVARVIAQSGLGKDEQKVNSGDVDDPTGEDGSEAGSVEGTATFETAVTKCATGNEDKAGGPPDHVLEKFGGEHPKDRESKGNQPVHPASAPERPPPTGDR